MRIGSLLALAATSLGACSLLVDVDALEGTAGDAGLADVTTTSSSSSSSSGGSSSSSSSGSDASPPLEAGADASPEPVCPLPNVVTNSGFEDNLVAWNSDGIPTIVSTAHRGTRALKLCGNPAFSYGVASQAVSTPDTALRLRVWVRRIAESASVSGGYLGGNRVETGPTGQPVAIAPTDQWQCVEASLDQGSFASLLFTLYKAVDMDGCVLLDDVEAFVTDGSPLDEACKCPVQE